MRVIAEALSSATFSQFGEVVPGACSFVHGEVLCLVCHSRREFSHDALGLPGGGFLCASTALGEGCYQHLQSVALLVIELSRHLHRIPILAKAVDQKLRARATLNKSPSARDLFSVA